MLKFVAGYLMVGIIVVTIMDLWIWNHRENFKFENFEYKSFLHWHFIGLIKFNTKVIIDDVLAIIAWPIFILSNFICDAALRNDPKKFEETVSQVRERMNEKKSRS